MLMDDRRDAGPDLHRHYDPTSTICGLFREQVGRRPDKTAVIEDGRSATYAQLAGLAATIGQALRARGVGHGDRVCLLARRGVLTVAAQLGVTAIGAAFVSLDPGSSARRHREVIGESGAKAIIAHPDHVGAAADLAEGDRPLLLLDDDATGTAGDFAALLDDPASSVGPDDLAYVIYTSGSTGRPKGVMIAHRGVCRLVRGQDYADLGPGQTMLNMSAVGFDAGIGEIYSAVLNGGTLAVLADATPSLDRIAQVIARDGVTVAYVTAGLFHVIAEHRPEIFRPLRQVFPCGDVLSETHVMRVRRALPHLRMINGYGPTENTVFTCCFAIDGGWTGGTVPIGRGLAHDRLFVLGDDLTVVAPGEVGQLAVGGAGVALGYLGRPDLTEASFPNLCAGGFDGRVYLTGDLVRIRPDGVVCFHGRIDRQIKIDGQRVEMDAVEHMLRADPEVEDAAVVAVPRADGGRKIVAFVKPAALDAEAVLRRMRDRLPAAAVPARMVLRDVLPLGPSGKVDRKRLAAELEGETCAVVSAAPAAAPVGAHAIRDAWAEVLGAKVVDDSRTFFDLGGTSLQLIALHALLQGRLGRRFDIARLFEAPRLRDLELLLGDPAPSGAMRADPVAARRAAMAQARSRRARVS